MVLGAFRHYSLQGIFILMLLMVMVWSGCCEWSEPAYEYYDYWTMNSKDTAESTASSPEDLCLPQHVHLSFGDSVDEVSVVWATKERCLSLVRYGTDPWDIIMESVATGNYTFFTKLNSDGLHHLYKVTLQKLRPETTYYYIPVSNESTAGPYYFKTLQHGNNWSPKFLMFGDLGIHTNTIPSLMDEALTGQYAALFHVGDLAYDMKNDNGQVGDYFLHLIQSVASSIPYMTCPGNHEIDSHSFAHYRHRFAMPGTEWPIPLEKMWYSIDIGPVHFVSYSSEVFFTNNGVYEDDQRQWLQQDLNKTNENRQKTPWIIAFGHRPMYCSTHIGDDCSQMNSFVRNGLEEIFYQQSVDLVVQAHEHNYERLWPMYRGEVTNKSYTNPNVPVQIITGAAGSKEGPDHFIPAIKPEWSAFRLDSESFNSYGYLHVVNFTHAYWEQRGIKDNSTLDSIWIVKTREFPSPQDVVSTPVASGSASVKTTDSFINHYTLIAITVFSTAGLVILLVFWIRILLRHYRRKSFETNWNEQDFELKKIMMEKTKDEKT